MTIKCNATGSFYRYGKKYFGSKLEQADTGPWRKMRARERREEERERFRKFLKYETFIVFSEKRRCQEIGEGLSELPASLSPETK